MEIYLVGGSVRDKLLGLPQHDRDFVVVGATTDDMVAQGFKPVGRDFPVFLHPETKEEYALARTERKTGLGYRGFVTQASPEVTLKQDLKRRDLTINAMAMRDDQLIDPYGGLADLKARLLRHVSPAFKEDPLRILRVARFAARYHNLGFKIAPETLSLISEMIATGELAYLKAERILTETKKALTGPSPEQYFLILKQFQALDSVIPEIGAHIHKHAPQLKALQLASSAQASELVCFACVSCHAFDGKQHLATIKHFANRLKLSCDFQKILELLDAFWALRLDFYNKDNASLADAIFQFLKQAKSQSKKAFFAQLMQSVYWLTLAQDLCLRPYEIVMEAAKTLKKNNAATLIRAGLAGKALGDQLMAQQKARIEAILKNK